MFAFDDFRQVVGDAKIECGRFEFDFLPREPRPLNSRISDPSDQIKMVHALKCAEICTLRRVRPVYDGRGRPCAPI